MIYLHCFGVWKTQGCRMPLANMLNLCACTRWLLLGNIVYLTLFWQSFFFFLIILSKISRVNPSISCYSRFLRSSTHDQAAILDLFYRSVHVHFWRLTVWREYSNLWYLTYFIHLFTFISLDRQCDGMV